MSKLLSLDEIQTETKVVVSDPNQAKFVQKSTKYWSMLVVQKNIWVNYLEKQHIIEFKKSPSKEWEIIELKSANNKSFNWIKGLERSEHIEEGL